MEGALTRYRLRITLAGYGKDEDSAEAFLEGFATTHSEVGAAVSQDTSADTLTVAFSLEASDPNDAVERARPIFMEGATASGLKPVEVIELNASLAETRELQPA